ncbi:hypothetical protein [Thalassobaculum sp.]|uniref:hypothetical protein n=1 Tax=Thalassobaculum sp. TaxID=2022740 RepID=UPI0032EC4BF6
MIGGRKSDGTLGGRFASLSLSFLWILTLLSVVVWSVSGTPPGVGARLPAVAEVGDPAAPDASPSGAALYAQLPVVPAMAEKRLAATGESTKGGPDQGDLDLPGSPPAIAAERGVEAAAVASVVPGEGPTGRVRARAPPADA